jgi:hypothetical protein
MVYRDLIELCGSGIWQGQSGFGSGIAAEFDGRFGHRFSHGNAAIADILSCIVSKRNHHKG